MNAQTYVVVMIGTSTVLVAGAQMAAGKLPQLRVFIGGTVAAFMLSVLASPLPALAKGLATLAILTTTLTSGYALAKPIAALVA